MKLKKLMELKNEKLQELQKITTVATTENRAMTEEEVARFDELEKEVRAIEETVSRLSKNFEASEIVEEAEMTKEDAEVRAFENYIKKAAGLEVEVRAGEQNLTMASNGAIIPTTIANRIITQVKEISPILSTCTMYNEKGTLKIPVWGLANTTHDIAVGFQEEFVAITADSGKFASVDLTGYLAGALVLLAESVVNNGSIDVVSFVTKEIARKVAVFFDKVLLNGQSQKNTGALATTTNLNAGSVSAISADNLIDLQLKVPTAYQSTSVWVMAPATFAAIRKIKDGAGNYMIVPDFAAGGNGYTILGKPVYLSENMPAIGSANKAILYGDMSGPAVNMRENVSIKVLKEKYADQHAIGVIAWFEFDSNVIDHQKLATLTLSA